MSIEVDRATVNCKTCGAAVSELRRGRCWGCYGKWAENRPVGLGALCQCCGERRRDLLRLVEFHGRSVPMCHNCGVRTLRLEPVPPTMEALRKHLNRDRRDEERRHGRPDGRLYPRERRVGDRRRDRPNFRGDKTDPAIFLAELEEMIIELDDGDIEMIEQTMVRERPKRPD